MCHAPLDRPLPAREVWWGGAERAGHTQDAEGAHLFPPARRLAPEWPPTNRRGSSTLGALSAVDSGVFCRCRAAGNSDACHPVRRGRTASSLSTYGTSAIAAARPAPPLPSCAACSRYGLEAASVAGRSSRQPAGGRCARAPFDAVRRRSGWESPLPPTHTWFAHRQRSSNTPRTRHVHPATQQAAPRRQRRRLPSFSRQWRPLHRCALPPRESIRMLTAGARGRGLRAAR